MANAPGKKTNREGSEFSEGLAIGNKIATACGPYNHYKL